MVDGETFLVILFLANACLGACGMFINYKFLSILKRKIPDKWIEMGSPSMFINNTIKGNLSVLLFLVKKEYLCSNDIKFIRFSRFVAVYNVIYLIIFVFFIAYLLIHVHFHVPS